MTTRRLAPADGSAGLGALLSGLLPGLGQFYQARWRRGLLMLLLPFAGLAVFAGVVLTLEPVAGVVIGRAALFALLLAGGLFAYHCAVALDAFAGRRGAAGLTRGRALDLAVLLAVVLGLSLGYFSAYRQSLGWARVLETVLVRAPDGRTVGAGTPSGTTTAPSWSGRERLNVLLLGVDTREEDAQLQNTDTVILLSLDPLAHTAAMLSIPRDTLVDVPGIGPQKINSAYVLGGGGDEGADLARRTVEDFLDIRIHTYAIIDFNAFRATIDSVGGVRLDVPRPLRDESYPTPDYGVERIRFLAGPQLLDGEQALRYARSRHDSNDFSRARRQQAVLLALRERLALAGIFRIPSIFDRVGPLVRTSFDADDVLPLARTALAVEAGGIRSEVLLPCDIDVPHCELSEQNDAGGYYLIPDLDKVRALVTSMFAGAPPASTR